MSWTPRGSGWNAIRAGLSDPSERALALLSAGLLTLSYLGVLYRVVNVVGDVVPFVVVALSAFALAVVLSRTLSERTALLVGLALLVGGLAMYLATVPRAYLNLSRSAADTVSLLTGLSVLRMTKVGIWGVGFTPGPVFVSWYFFLRRDYAAGALVGGAALAWFVLTGDAGTLVALAGALGAIGAVGIGELDRLGGSRAQLHTLGALLVAVLVITTSISIVPGGEARPLLPDVGSASVEASLTNAGERVSLIGSIRLSPAVRFTVTTDRGERWRAGAYDRYTGGDWVRTGEAVPYRRPLPSPPGRTRTVVQRFAVESRVSTMPAAWKPVRVGSGSYRARVTDLGGLVPSGSLGPGEEYTVESAVPQSSPARLRRADEDYPPAIRERYTQLPESTPRRVGRLTDRVTAEATNPYDTAVAIERFLESEKGYSLDVSRPEGDVADGFLFEMSQGYCTYFATTMVTMLRTQGIPARFVVGYLPGQQVAEDQWVVRGFDSHAWVEVYFPGTGWVTFDPTPAGPRRQAEMARLEQARANDEENVDTAETSAADASVAEAGPSFTAVENESRVGGVGAMPAVDAAEGEPALTPGAREVARSADAGATGGGIPMPSREEAAYGLVLIAGAVVAGIRLGTFDRLYRRYWLRRPLDGPPRDRIVEAGRRLEYLMGRRHRPRRSTETPREYRAALEGFGVDDRALRLYILYEQARYGAPVDTADATEAVRLFRDLHNGRSWWPGALG